MSEFKVGDEVAATQYGEFHKSTVVTRATKTFVECADGSKWTALGREWGNTALYGRKSISNLSNPSTRATYERHMLDQRIKSLRSGIVYKVKHVNDVGALQAFYNLCVQSEVPQ